MLREDRDWDGLKEMLELPRDDKESEPNFFSLWYLVCGPFMKWLI